MTEFSEYSAICLDDDCAIASEYESILTDLGFRAVVKATSLHEAFAAANATVFDLALLDYNLEAGNNSGFLASQLAEGGTKVIFITGDISQIDQFDARTTVLEKPVSLAALEARIRETLTSK